MKLSKAEKLVKEFAEAMTYLGLEDRIAAVFERYDSRDKNDWLRDYIWIADYDKFYPGTKDLFVCFFKKKEESVKETRFPGLYYRSMRMHFFQSILREKLMRLKNLR